MSTDQEKKSPIIEQVGGILNINMNKARIWFKGGIARSIETDGSIKIDMKVSEVDIREPIKKGQYCQLQIGIPDLKEMMKDAEER